MEIHDKIPEQFCPQVQVAACYLEVNGKLLLLQRSDSKSEPGKWGVPAGKLEKNETPENAVRRELFEETGIDLERSSCRIEYIGPLYIRKAGFDFIYHSFKVWDCSSQPNQIPDVHISDEHQNYIWAPTNDLKNMPLMAGALEAWQHTQATPPKKRSGTSVSSYLILLQRNQVLLGLRQNTGYNDGLWSLVAGHVEDGESATSAIIREAREEIGIQLSPIHIQMVYTMHRKSNRQNVDFFFACSSWDGIIQNCEPTKCDKWQFFPLEELPSNMVDYNAHVLKAMTTGEFYSERGWDQFSV
jgi:8-oxo-dGTP pyrophosphatase MutT (NUDIX family)